MKKITISLLFIGLVVLSSIAYFTSRETNPDELSLLKIKMAKKTTKSVDHSIFEVLNKDFNNPREITAACISCHNQTHKEVMKSNHWNWEKPEYIEGRGIVYLGKKNAINNFCISAEGNEESCAKCHIGFGMTSSNFSFTDSTNIDCLVCHDQTGTYMKAPEKGGAPVMTLNFRNIARNVGMPTRENCGVCHFYGGGGNNVKHGDLESALFEPAKSVDVHMGTDGGNLQCVDCHETEDHNISGKLYSLSSMNRNRTECEDCHGKKPHNDRILNNHNLKVACQTCHIPVYAKVNATKTEWDWSSAGKLKDGKPFELDDADGNHTYLSIKGSFKWGKHLEPDYVWFNGTASHYLLGDKIKDTSSALVLNKLNGSYADRGSKIIPVKIHRARQPYDPVNSILIKPKLYADKEGEGALWKDFDWYIASEKGMQDVGLPFSGEVSFIETEMYWPINHMVSTKENTLACTDCHNSNDSRLAGLKDFYMPARDKSSLIENSGKALVLLTIGGIFLHGTGRYISSRRNKKRA